MYNTVLFVVFPYVAVIIAIVGSFYRYRKARFTYSSLSSQFLENRELFWGSVPWHYGVILILATHVLGFMFPSLWSSLLSDRIRLYVLEITGHILALMTVVGLAILVIRRLRSSRVFAVTSHVDWLLLIVLLVQVAAGFWIALVYRWGSGWYVHTAVPWLWSLVVFNPQIQFVTGLPWLVQLHLLAGFLLILLFPFTRLVHLVTFPITYLWRPLQVVIWNRRSASKSGN